MIHIKIEVAKSISILVSWCRGKFQANKILVFAGVFPIYPLDLIFVAACNALIIIYWIVGIALSLTVCLFNEMSFFFHSLNQKFHIPENWIYMLEISHCQGIYLMSTSLILELCRSNGLNNFLISDNLIWILLSEIWLDTNYLL